MKEKEKREAQREGGGSERELPTTSRSSEETAELTELNKYVRLVGRSLLLGAARVLLRFLLLILDLLRDKLRHIKILRVSLSKINLNQAVPNSVDGKEFQRAVKMKDLLPEGRGNKKVKLGKKVGWLLQSHIFFSFLRNGSDL